MSSNERLTIVFIALLIAYLIPARLILWRFLQPYAKKTLIVITLLYIFVGTMNGLTRWQRSFPGWFFASNTELAFIAMLSSIQLMLAGLVALLNANHHRPSLKHMLPWLLMTVVFVFMSLDEYYSIHESSDIWNTLYTFNGIGLIVLAGVIFYLKRDFTAPLFLVIGVGLIGFGGVIMDEFSNEVPLSFGGIELVCHYKIQGIFCTDLGVVEELFELGGSGMILVGFVSYAQKHHTPRRWQITRWAVAGLAVFWALWMFSQTWLVPTVEAKINAESVTVEYMDGALELESYHVSPSVAAPGDTVHLTLFFHTTKMLNQDYYLSVHLLSHPDVNSEAQVDTQLGDYDYPTTAWLPYLSVETVVKLKLPPDLPTDESYWIMVRVWEGPGGAQKADDPVKPDQQGDTILITQTDRQLLAPDTVVLAALPVPGNPPEAAPITPADYRFANGIRLYGYDLPEQGEPDQEIPIRFWWKTDRASNETLTQFLHFYPTDGSEDFYTFDGQPLGESFPLSDWPQGLDTAGTRTITLPADIPPGEYRVHTGLYDPNTGNRITIKDASGAPVQDNSILLGVFTVK